MTLDAVERKLSPEMLVICDEEKPSAVAGVMGGEYSGIMDDTDTIVFESACFLGSSIRTTARKLGMRTESSARFEKGLDSETCIPAVMRACELVELLGAGEVIQGVIDVDNAGYKPTQITLNPQWINEFIGINASRDRNGLHLEQLGCRMNGDTIIVPSFRKDLEHKADIAEEIARFHGYDKIPSTAIRGTAQGALTEYQKFERTVSETLLAQGCYEISTYSFISPKYYDKICLPADSALRKSVVILNPLGEDTSVMRTIVVPSMMEVLSRNYNNRNASASLYELANEYIPVEGQELPDEKPVITIGQYGESHDFSR